jgi:HTH-like domain
MAAEATLWKISRASVYRSLKETPPNTIAGHPGPVGACSDVELAEHIRQHIAASRLHGEGYRKLWARLRFAGVRTSPHRVRRVMRENGLLAPQAESGPSAIPAPHPLGAGINCLRSAKIDLLSSARTSWGNQQCGNENKGRSAIEERRIGAELANDSDQPEFLISIARPLFDTFSWLMARGRGEMPRTAGEPPSAGSPFALGSCSRVYGASVGAEAPTKRRPGP